LWERVPPIERTTKRRWFYDRVVNGQKCVVGGRFAGRWFSRAWLRVGVQLLLCSSDRSPNESPRIGS
jgi:hypothetical protein